MTLLQTTETEAKQRLPRRPWWRIISRLQGGLGNQLFIYASSVELGERLALPVRFDTVSAYRSDTFERRYELPDLAVDVPLANRLESIRIRGRSALVRAVERFERGRSPGDRHFLREGFGGADCHLLELQRQKRWIYLEGYWQDFRFFDRQRPKLLRQVQRARKFYSGELNSLPASHAIGIHVRQRTGYSASGKQIFDWRPVLTLGYYKAAIREVLSHTAIDIALLFGDDREFMRRLAVVTNDSFGLAAKVVEGSRPAADLLAMSSCRALVLSASTFAWWAAYLSTTAEVVLHPGLHDNGTPFPTPASWSILSARDLGGRIRPAI